MNSEFSKLDFENPPANPIGILQQWIADATELGMPNPNAMALATVDADGRPSARIVLLKGLDERGAVFYTNRNSRKGRGLSANPRAALLFHWDPLGRQARIEGDVTLTSDAESDSYFATRPRESQIAAWASRQSEFADSRAELDAAVVEYQRKFEGGDVPRPPYWGGYRVSLNSIEFWQGHLFRLHDRVVYIPDATGMDRGGWVVRRLFP